jgi:hypothetical protein
MPITEVLTEQGTTAKITRQHVGPATVAIYGGDTYRRKREPFKQ